MNIIIYPRKVLKVINEGFDQFHENYHYYTTDRSANVPNEQQQFFIARASILSWLIFKDAFGKKEVTGTEKQVPALEVLQQYAEAGEFLFIFDDRSPKAPRVA